MATGTVNELWRFPVKSMRGERVDALRVDARGAGGDRTYAVWDRGKQLTAREAKGLLTWSARYGAPGEALDPAAPPLAQLVAPGGTPFAANDPALPAALSASLDRDGLELRRDVAGQQDLGNSLLITTEASHRALESELGVAIDPRRFRTNLHLDLDAAPWEELGWEGTTLTLSGGVVLRLLHPCERCAIPTRDPETGEKWPTLLRHLAREHETLFGINARVEAPGTIRVGERVVVAGHPPPGRTSPAS